MSIALASLVLAGGCLGLHHTASRSYSPTLYGSLRQGGEPVAGTVVAVGPDGAIAARIHTPANNASVALNLPGGKTYVIRGTTDDGKSCGPVSEAIPVWHGPGASEPAFTVTITCTP